MAVGLWSSNAIQFVTTAACAVKPAARNADAASRLNDRLVFWCLIMVCWVVDGMNIDGAAEWVWRLKTNQGRLVARPTVFGVYASAISDEAAQHAV